MKGLLIVLALAVAPAALAKDNDPKGHPPGLAKKAGGMPPGQAKKMWGKGERLPSAYVQPRYYVSEPARYSLPAAPPGYRWILVEDNAYLAQSQTGLIADVILGLLSR